MSKPLVLEFDDKDLHKTSILILMKKVLSKFLSKSITVYSPITLFDVFT